MIEYTDIEQFVENHKVLVATEKVGDENLTLYKEIGDKNQDYQIYHGNDLVFAVGNLKAAVKCFNCFVYRYK